MLPMTRLPSLTAVGLLFADKTAGNAGAPQNGLGRLRESYLEFSRVSMETVFQIPWDYLGNGTMQRPESGIRRLKELGLKTAAMALSDDAVSIREPRLLTEEKLAIILGIEGDGLTARTIADCDYTVRIPMSHGVDSLNVAAAGAVAFWQLGGRE